MKKSFIIAFILIAVFAAGFAAEKIDRVKILEDDEWRQNYAAYEPDQAILEILKTKIGDNLKIDVYLGFWCGDSRNNVPVFLKIIDGIESDTLKIDYYSVERKPTKETQYFVEELKIERVPTFIFYRDGKEIGRIIENPKKNMLDDFLEIVF